jgi:hypothetical protein
MAHYVGAEGAAQPGRGRQGPGPSDGPGHAAAGGAADGAAPALDGGVTSPAAPPPEQGAAVAAPAARGCAPTISPASLAPVSACAPPGPKPNSNTDLFASDAFRIGAFKVLACSKRAPHDWCGPHRLPRCARAHGVILLIRAPPARRAQIQPLWPPPPVPAGSPQPVAAAAARTQRPRGAPTLCRPRAPVSGPTGLGPGCSG